MTQQATPMMRGAKPPKGATERWYYTFGKTTEYEKCFAELGCVVKVGLQDGYGGGAVFESIDEARLFLVKAGYMMEYSVYKLWTWPANTYIHEDGTRRILREASVYRLEVKDTLIAATTQ